MIKGSLGNLKCKLDNESFWLVGLLLRLDLKVGPHHIFLQRFVKSSRKKSEFNGLNRNFAILMQMFGAWWTAKCIEAFSKFYYHDNYLSFTSSFYGSFKSVIDKRKQDFIWCLLPSDSITESL